MSRALAALGLLVTLVGCTGNTATGTPTPTASATSATVTGPVLYLQDPQKSRQRIVIDWGGHRVGLVSGVRLTPSSDGSILLDGSGNAIDRQGKVIGPMNLKADWTRDVAWADDSRHLCAILTDPQHGPDEGLSSLWLAAPGEQPRKVAAVGQPRSGTGVAACSIAHDVAVIASNRTASWPIGGDHYLVTDAVEVVQLSSGKILTTRQYSAAIPSGLPDPANPPDWVLVVASPDGSLLAENHQKGNADIRDLSTGQIVGRVRSQTVIGFSSDDSRAVVAGNPGARVITWRDQQIVWQTSVRAQWVVPLTRAADLVLATEVPDGLLDLVHVGPDGTGTVIAHNVFPEVPCPCLGAGGS